MAGRMTRQPEDTPMYTRLLISISVLALVAGTSFVVAEEKQAPAPKAETGQPKVEPKSKAEPKAGEKAEPKAKDGKKAGEKADPKPDPKAKTGEKAEPKAKEKVDTKKAGEKGDTKTDRKADKKADKKTDRKAGDADKKDGKTATKDVKK